MNRFKPPEECPVCGETVPRNARACPKCGACEKSGWNEDSDEDAFDYESFVAEEFGSGRKKPAKEWFWWLAALAVLIAFGWIFLAPHF